jgi:hypothetical protein
LFGATTIMICELKGQVPEACLTSLLNQVIQDSTFYLASSEHPQGNPIRTVSVEIRRQPLVQSPCLNRSLTPLLVNPRADSRLGTPV